MKTVKDIVMDIISMYTIAGTDMIYPTRMVGWDGEGLFWQEEITNTLQRLFAIDPDVMYSYSSGNFDCYAIRWREGDESHRVFVKVFRD